MTDDYKNIDRTAQALVVEYKSAAGSPPDYGAGWNIAYGAKVDRIEINYGIKPSVAVIWFPEFRWDTQSPLKNSDMVRIRTDSPSPSIVFSGFVTSPLKQFSGGGLSDGSYERNAVKCLDYRWLLSATSPIYGQIARGPDDYDGYGTADQVAISDAWTFLSGQRCIFNPDGKPNRDPVDLVVSTVNFSTDVPIFIDTEKGEYFTAKQMLQYILNPLLNRAFKYFPLFDISQNPSLNHDDWDKVLHNIIIDGLGAIEAVELICRNIGWSFRQSSTTNQTAYLEFFKPGHADSYNRSLSNPTILHSLHAPAVGDSVKISVDWGKKLLWSMTYEGDTADIINQPWSIGSPHRFEITAELVPAWLDEDLEPETEGSLYLTEAQLQDITNPNDYNYYKHYHVRGESFKRAVGRKWALNESGRYTNENDYDRGTPFDFSEVIPEKYIKNKKQKRLFAPYRRQLLPCLTLDKENLNSVGIVVEFSFDSGENWQIIPCSISSLTDECGIYIEEENLCEMIDQAGGIIPEGSLSGEELNYWVSLCHDNIEFFLHEEEEEDYEWKTRIRVTASIQMDQRVLRPSPRQSSSGSLFELVALYDFSDKYSLQKRTESSRFHESDLDAWEVDSTEQITAHIDGIRNANQDMSISGQFILDRLWLGEGSGQPDFMVGDGIKNITGRDYDLKANLAGSTVYPEIVKIVYSPERQHTELITRDLRFAEVVL